MKPFSVLLNPRQDLYHSGYLLSAAISAGATLIVDQSVHPLVPRIVIGGLKYAVDLRDSSRLFDEDSLAYCDAYFKRSYVPLDVPAGSVDKVFPFGLNYACRSTYSLLKVLSLYGRSGVRPTGWKNYLLAPLPKAFEMPPAEAFDATILFQTRLWPRNELGPTDSPEAVNGPRIELVRELKRAFGKRFVGGLVPNREARNFPDLLTPVPTRRSEYARCSRAPAIGIYTRGLHGSNAFKVAEYLAASKCIVGQQLCHELPQPLGECHAIRETVEEIVVECEALLADPARLQSIRRQSWRYYQSHLRYDRRLAVLFRPLRAPKPIRRQALAPFARECADKRCRWSWDGMCGHASHYFAPGKGLGKCASFEPL